MLVSGVWAVAATVVALIALLDRSDGNAEERAGAATDRVAGIERRQRALGRRVGSVSSRFKGLANSGDVVKLQLRVGQLQAIAAGAAKRATKAEKAATDLGDRVKRFESALSAAQANPAPPPAADSGGGAEP